MIIDIGSVQVDCPEDYDVRAREQFTMSYKGKSLFLEFLSREAAQDYIRAGVRAGNDRSDYGKIVGREVVTITTPWSDS